MSQYIRFPAPGGGNGVAAYANFAALPATADDGTVAVTLDTDTLYVFNSGSSTWYAVASPGAALSIGTIGSASPSANGAVISSNALILQLASVTVPGLMSTGSQSIAGTKTFTGAISASNLSGTNTGDVTLGTANGLGISGQVLSLALSSTSTTGALSSTDWNTFNGKQAAGNYITALTGDATASGPGSAALTLATVNSNVGSFGSASNTLTVTVNAKGLVTAMAASAIQIAESQVTNLVSDLAGKQPVGNYITALTGDGTASGPGSAAFTLATVNANVGSFGSASAVTTLTVNAKGLVTAAASTSIQIAESQVTNLVSDLAAKQSTALTSAHILVGNVSNVATDVAMTGDISISNAGLTAIGANKVLDTMIRQSTALTVIGRSANSTGNVADIAAGTDGNVLRRSGTTLGFGSLDLSAAGTVGASVLGVANGGTGVATLTAHGVVIGNGTSAVNVTSAGSSGQALISNGASADPSFQAVPFGNYAVTSKSTTYAASTSDNIILVDDSGGSWTLTLPTAIGNAGKTFIITKTNSGLSTSVTLATTSAQTINGFASGALKLNTQYESYQIASDNANWTIVEHKTVTDWTSYTPTFTNYGTVTSVSFYWKRVGDSLQVRGSAIAGTVVASPGVVTLPSSLTIDSAKISSTNLTTEVGISIAAGAGGNANPYSGGEAVPVIIDTGSLGQVQLGQSSTTTFAGLNVTGYIGSNKWFTYRFEVPISGWNS